jgi:hypothetical protein
VGGQRVGQRGVESITPPPASRIEMTGNDLPIVLGHGYRDNLIGTGNEARNRTSDALGIRVVSVGQRLACMQDLAR